MKRKALIFDTSLFIERYRLIDGGVRLGSSSGVEMASRIGSLPWLKLTKFERKRMFRVVFRQDFKQRHYRRFLSIGLAY